jgi:hypothetical protein
MLYQHSVKPLALAAVVTILPAMAFGQTPTPTDVFQTANVSNLQTADTFLNLANGIDKLTMWGGGYWSGV